ncbi:MAG: choice-of-anchor tandem repeat GloVer-containing protein, partial [Prosthecobacter sp.]
MTSRSLVTVVLASLSLIHPAAADPAIEPLVGFEVGPTPYGGAGTFPSRAALYKHTDGNFYSTLPGAGAFGAGALIQMKPTGEIGQLSFSTNLGSQPGANPVSTLCLSSDGWLWGTTPLGGVTNSYGTVFRMRPETGEFQTMHSFANGSGTRSRAGLVSDGQGYLWGTTYNSNANTGNGTIFRIHELTGVFETRLSFGGDIAPRGSQPTAALYYDGAGNLWGTTLYSGSGTGYPTVFKYNISSNTLITVGEFSGSSTVVNKIKGEGETSVLTSDGNGFLWGMTFLGGTSGYGTVFKVEMATNTTTSVLEFSNNAATNKGSYPVGSLVNDGAGFLWGVASNGGTGDEGTVFKIAHSTGVLTTVLQFGSLTGANVNVMRPVNGLTNDGNGYLWGLASYEFPGVPWAVYKIKMSDNSFTKVAEHQTGGVSYLGRTPLAGLAGSATSPWLWGTASVGGTNNLGTLFRYDPSTGQQQVITNFTGQTGTALGSKPNGKVHVDTSGVVWGTTEEGGTSNVGTIFKYDPATSTFSTVQSFSTGGGNRPKGALAGMSDGFIWGTASSGPSSSSGSVFKINPATSAVTVVHGFPSSISAEGYQLVCGLAEDSNGFVWGTAQAGGANGQGVIFKIEKNTGIFTVAASLTSGGGQAAGSLVVDASGNVWGSDSLRIFKFLPVTSALTYVFTAEAIAYPNKGVYRGTLSKTATGNIRFLGTETTQDYTTYLSPRAVIYEINASTNVVTKIRSLMEAGTGGSSPAELPAAGPLYEHTDGNLYGASSANGFTQDLSPAGGGMIYRVRTGPAVKTQAFSNTNALYYTAVTGTTATLRSMVNPNGNATTCVFEWGPTTAMGNTVTANAPVGSGFTSSLCQATLTGLPQNRTFFYRVRADSTGEPSLGDVMSFSTAAIATPPNAEISVESPIGQSLTDNVTTVNLGEHLVGRAYKQSVVVRNLSTGTGVGELNGLTAIVTGVNAGDFAITTPLTATILTPTVTSAGLLITFTASGSGARSALLTITSNDSDEANFEIPLTGEGLIQPEIEVDSTTAANLQSHEANYDFGSGTLNVGIARPFTIRNTGNAALSSL